jgi:hypothetical protein
MNKRTIIKMVNKIKENMYKQLNELKEDTNKHLSEIRKNVGYEEEFNKDIEILKKSN